MSNGIKELFFSKKNLDITFDSVKQNIQRSNGYDISNNRKLKDNYNKMSLLVFEKTNDYNKNLVNLNNLLVEKASSYFTKLIDNRNSGKQSNIQSNNVGNYATINNMKNKYNELVKNRGESNESNSYMPTNQVPHSQINATPRPLNNYIDSGKNPSNSVYENNEHNENNVNILPFTLSDEFINEINNNDQPIYNNMDTLENNESKDAMILLKEQQNNRDLEMQKYTNNLKKIKQNTNNMEPNMFDNFDLNYNNNSNNNNSNNNNSNSNTSNFNTLSVGRDDALKDTRVDIINANPKDMYAKNEDLTNRMVSSMTANNIEGNQTTNNFEQMFMDTLHKMNIDYRTDNQPQYLEKEHFVSVNSIDRNWSSASTTDTRYNFKVSFGDNRGSDGPQNAIIDTLFKNVVSIELINVYIPQDPIIIPFDNRIYLDALHYPYLLLQIDEINSVFRSSNNASNNAFSQLMFDKEHSSQVISSDYIADASEGSQSNTLLDAGKTKFEKQYKRGYYRFIPSFFEKKQYYNAPLASLNTMNIRINNSDGDILNEELDVLTISTVAFTASADFEIFGTLGFPATAAGKYIKITTSTFFYNKQFKIGDRIKISGVTHGTSAVNDYITRSKGHVILNLKLENLGGSANKSFIDEIYISPPGNMNTDGTTLENNSESGAFTVSSGKLINMSLQTNLLFKIITREVDVQSVTKPQNI